MPTDTANILYLEREDDDGTYIDEISLPTKREVCPRCDGKGTHTNPSIDGNGISAEEWAEWTADSQEMYLTGGYDVRCEECGGRNVVEVVDEARLSPEQLAGWHAQLADEAAYRAEVAAERRMGA